MEIKRFADPFRIDAALIWKRAEECTARLINDLLEYGTRVFLWGRGGRWVRVGNADWEVPASGDTHGLSEKKFQSSSVDAIVG